MITPHVDPVPISQPSPWGFIPPQPTSQKPLVQESTFRTRLACRHLLAKWVILKAPRALPFECAKLPEFSFYYSKLPKLFSDYSTSSPLQCSSSPQSKLSMLLSNPSLGMSLHTAYHCSPKPCLDMAPREYEPYLNMASHVVYYCRSTPYHCNYRPPLSMVTHLPLSINAHGYIHQKRGSCS